MFEDVYAAQSYNEPCHVQTKAIIDCHPKT